VGQRGRFVKGWGVVRGEWRLSTHCRHSGPEGDDNMLALILADRFLGANSLWPGRSAATRLTQAADDKQQILNGLAARLRQMPDLVPIMDIAAYGIIGAAFLALAERLVPVVPSYGLFIFLGSSMVERPIDLLPLVVATTLASTLGAVCWYGLGYALGEARTHDLVRRFGRFVWLREKVYLSLSDRYSRNAFVATFIGQTIPVVRVYLSLPAGILALPLPTFTLAVLSGSALWVGGFISLGYGLDVLGWNPVVTTLVAVCVLIVIEGGLVWLIRRHQQKTAVVPVLTVKS